MSDDGPARAGGILPAQAIAALTERGAIRPATPYAPDQIQPVSYSSLGWW